LPPDSGVSLKKERPQAGSTTAKKPADKLLRTGTLRRLLRNCYFLTCNIYIFFVLFILLVTCEWDK